MFQKSRHHLEQILNFKFRILSILSFLFLVAIPIAHSLPTQPVEKKWVLNGAVNAAVQTVDGTTYLAGDFDHIGEYSGSALPFDLPKDAASHPTLSPQFPKVDGGVSVIIPDNKGGWYLGGSFSRVGKSDRKNLVHLLPDYSVDNRFRPDPDGSVRYLALGREHLYVSGEFEKIIDENTLQQPIRNVARFNVQTEKWDVNWKPIPDNGTKTYSPTHSLLIDPEAAAGEEIVYMGNYREQSVPFRGVILIPYLSKFKNGVLETGFNLTLGSPSAILLNKGSLYIAESSRWVYLSEVGPPSFVSSKLRRYSAATGQLDSTWLPKISGTALINSLIISDDGKTLYIGGDDNTGRSIPPRLDGGGANRETISLLSKLDISTATIDSLWKPDLEKGSVEAVALHANDLYVGGSFQTVKDDKGVLQPIRNLTRIDRITGIPVISWKPDLGGNVSVLAMNENTLYVGGGFQMMGGVEIKNLARFNKKGEPDLNWKPNPNQPVNALAWVKDHLYLGGEFTEVFNQPSSYLARLDQAGSLDLGWKPNVRLSRMEKGYINAFAVNRETLYVGGNFDKISDSQGEHNLLSLARFNNSVLDLDWHPNPFNQDRSFHSSLIKSIVIDSDQDILYVGGGFQETLDKNGVAQPIRGLVRFKSGVLDLNWSPNPIAVPGKAEGEDLCDFCTTVTSLALSEGKLYVGGVFKKIKDDKISAYREIPHLAKFNVGKTAPQLDLMWTPNPIPTGNLTDPVIHTLAVSGNTLYVGGEFQGISDINGGSLKLRSLARFDQGILNSKWNPNFERPVGKLVLTDDSLYVTSGATTSAGKLFSPRVDQFQSFVQFSQAEIQANRRDQEVNLEVDLSQADSSEVTVDYAITGGTAKKGNDYQFINGTLKIPAGDTKGFVSLTIVNNPTVSEDKTIELSLSNPTGVFLGENKKLTYTIKPSSNGGDSKDLMNGSQSSAGGCSMTGLDSKNFKMAYLLFLVSVSLIFLRYRKVKINLSRKHS